MEQDGFWFEGIEGTGNQFESARLSRDWVRTRSIYENSMSDLPRVKFDFFSSFIFLGLHLHHKSLSREQIDLRLSNSPTCFVDPNPLSPLANDREAALEAFGIVKLRRNH